MKILLLWWIAMLLIGVAFFPLTNRIFRKFEDRGWLFSKMIGLFLSSWVLFTLNCMKLVGFVQSHAVVAIAFMCILSYGIYALWGKLHGEGQKYDLLDGFRISWKLILFEEALFLFWFGLSLYVIGFKPEAYGTEKFMDYGFMTSMMRSLWMPFADPWYGGENVNYYYGGQYIASFLTKLTGVTAGEGYNLMRALVTSCSFVLPFSLVHQLLSDRLRADGHGAVVTRPHRIAPVAGGLLGGTAVAFCGNFHYVIYGVILPIVSRIRGEDYSYWFPDSTRYIGYNPDLPDKTIHEYPAYSSVLGDLHAHYVNILFVVTVTAVVYAWAKKQDPRRQDKMPFFATEVLLIGFMTGAFRWTNFWDFPIYYVVCGSIFFFVLLRAYQGEIMKFIVMMLGIAAVMLGVGLLSALPFTLTFDTISTSVGLTHSHSLPHQLLVLWWLPAVCLIAFIVQLILERREMKRTSPHALWKVRKMALPDLAVLMFGLCAAGLVFLPEVIYVKDIYSADHYRANTMFKLTYQAFILFGMCMAYILTRAVITGTDRMREAAAARTAQNSSGELPADSSLKKSSADSDAGIRTEEDDGESPEENAPGKPQRRAPAVIETALGIAGIALLLLMAGYTVQSVHDWFGNVLDPSQRVHSDASVFVSEYFQSDFEAINWLNNNVNGQSVILEAPGDSYSDYCRVSVATGLPTVIGWKVHEWLWRGDVEAVDARIADCDTIYTSGNREEVEALLEKYRIRFIYIGTLERQRYPELQDKLLQSLGEVVYSNGEDTYIIEIRR